MKTTAVSFSFTLCLFVGGCVVGPNYQQPDLSAQLPASYRNAMHAQSQRAPDFWWKTFDDAAINQLVDAALQRNLDLTAANAQIQQARAQVGVVESTLLPQLAANARIGRDRFSENSALFANIPIANPVTNFADYRVGFDASWELDLFGRNARQIESTKAHLSSIEYQREDIALRIAAEVTRNVIAYRAWQLRRQNEEVILLDNQRILELIQLQQNTGLISESEFNDAQIATHNAAALIPPLHSAALASLMAITVLTNQPQEYVAALLEPNTTIPTVSVQLDFLGLPSDLLLRRPDLRSAERALAAATADIGVAVAEQYPQLVLIGSGGLDSITPGKLTNLASRYWNIGPELTIPLFSGGRLTSQVHASESARDVALAHYRQAVLTAFADTETALIRFSSEQQRLMQINQALTSQRRQLELAQTQFLVGETNFVPVLQTRLQLAQIKEQQFASQQALAENLTALFKSLGGGLSIGKNPST